MAEFEGNLNLNVETSEIEIKGKFKLTEEELDKVAGGSTPPTFSRYHDDGYTYEFCSRNCGSTRETCDATGVVTENITDPSCQHLWQFMNEGPSYCSRGPIL